MKLPTLKKYKPALHSKNLLKTTNCSNLWTSAEFSIMVPLTLPYLTSGVGRLLHLPSAEAVSVRPNAHPRM